MGENKSQLKIAAALAFICAAVFLTLFRHYEPSGETWGYWFFSRLFAETGKFVIMDRSPLYVIYLNLFRWMGFPSSVIAEYIVTSLFVMCSVIFLLKRHITMKWAVFAAVLWLPFMQSAEPPVQKFALAFSCLAIAVRDSERRKFRLSLSYALIGLAYMFRMTYIIFIPVFLMWDGISIMRRGKNQNFFSFFRPRIQDWPLLVVLALFVWFGAAQSLHPWNNAQIATTKWFPGTASKNLSDASFIQAFNWKYIEHKYGSFEGKDFYFTNQEVFGGANTMMGAIRANPKFVAMQIGRNVEEAISSALHLTMVPVSSPFSQKIFNYGLHFFLIIILFAIIAGAFYACKSRIMVLFIMLNILLIGTAIVSMPKTRYMFPLIPIYSLSAYWFGDKIRKMLFNPFASPKAGRKIIFLGQWISIPVCLILFSNGFTDWERIAKDIIHDVRKNNLKIMERREFSLKGSQQSVELLCQKCNGVMTIDHPFLASFSKISLNKIFDIWEIPPFDRFGSSSYNGMRPDRIDCLLISKNLVTGVGAATNYKIRYENYILPYANYLKSIGATQYEISGFGQAVILENPQIGFQNSEDRN